MRVSVVIPALCLLAGQPSVPAQKSPASSPAENYGKLPLSFEANAGQTDSQVRFVTRGQGYSLFLTDSAAVLALTRHPANPARPGDPAVHSVMKADVVRMQLAGAAPGVRVDGTNQLSGIANYFVGKDPAKWHSNIPTYAQVKYSGVYPGVDLVYHGNQGQLEFDFIVAPRADVKPVHLHFAGVRKLKLSPEGDLILTAQNGEIALRKPVAYQVKNGQREPVDGRFTLSAKNAVGFQLGRYDHDHELIIDPTLAYSTYLGGNAVEANNEGAGNNGDYATTMTVDGFGNVYVAGAAFSQDFPVTGNAFQKQNYPGSAGSQGANGDSFISKLNAAGSALIYSTYFGGSGSPLSGLIDGVKAIAIDGSGNAYVTGHANSPDFPTTTGAFQTVNSASGKAYVTKLNPTGSALVYSTLLGGSIDDSGVAIAVDTSGNAYIAGNTQSTDFPTTTGAFQRVFRSSMGITGFVTKLNATGTAEIYSSFLGGSTGIDSANSISLDKSGDAYVGGSAGSSDFPTTTGAYETANIYSGFVAKLNPAGSGLIYSTYFPISFMAVDGSGNVYTISDAGPVTSGAFQASGKGWVGKLNPSGSALVYGTYVGGTSPPTPIIEEPGQSVPGQPGDLTAVSVDQQGHAFVAGYSYGGFPVTSDAFQAAYNGIYQYPDEGEGAPSNAILAELNAGGTALLYGTYLGGSGVYIYADDSPYSVGELPYALAVDSIGNVYIAGSTASSNFPVTSGAFQATNNAAAFDASNAFISKFAFNGATTTSLTSSANPQEPGGNVTFGSAVAPVSGTGTPTGIVQFILNGSPLTNVPLDPAGQASYSTTSLPTGSNTIVASYLGDPSNSSSSAALTQTILAAPAATPVISPAGGAFTSGFQTTITTSTVDATIHYTVNGSMPSAASPTYSGPIEIAADTVLQAVTIEPGAPPSAVASATYIVDAGPGSIQFPAPIGFGVAQGTMALNGSAKLSGYDLLLTDGGTYEAGSAFYATPVNVTQFATTFTFQLTSAVADGFTFTIQNTGPTALGRNGAGLGYVTIHHSVAIKFDLYNNAGEGADSTGLFTAGNLPTVPAIDLTETGINLHSGDEMSVTMTYNGTILNVAITDEDSGATYVHAYTIDIPGEMTGTTGYVGFTGATGGGTAIQAIHSWTYSTLPAIPNYGNGFYGVPGMTFNGSAGYSETSLSLTNIGGENENGSAFYSTPVPITAFTTNFTFQILAPVANGFTFTIQNTGPTALGGYGAGLGYVTIHHSVAIKFDLCNSAGEGPDSTGLYTAGNIPTVPAVNLTGTGIDLHSGHEINAQIAYDGINLTLYLTDLVTLATWSHSFPIDIPAAVFGSTAYVGFTGSTGGGTAYQNILNWTYGLP